MENTTGLCSYKRKGLLFAKHHPVFTPPSGRTATINEKVMSNCHLGNLGLYHAINIPFILSSFPFLQLKIHYSPHICSSGEGSSTWSIDSISLSKDTAWPAECFQYFLFLCPVLTHLSSCKCDRFHCSWAGSSIVPILRMDATSCSDSLYSKLNKIHQIFVLIVRIIRKYVVSKISTKKRCWHHESQDKLLN